MPQRPHNFRALSKPKPIQKSHHKHYWPYLPLLLLVFGTFLTSSFQPVKSHGVLAYATSMSNSELLMATNSQRAQNGAQNLTINQQLTSAAQAKANDMIARNYWSHNTPDGQEPWVFMDNAGYKYQKAGENLAYGFDTSDDTITGWMNSPPHRSNLLDSDFNEVGFGFANSSDYNNSGSETVVVAMYGKPQVLSANQTATAPAAASQASQTASGPTTPAPKSVATTQAIPAPASAQPNTSQSPTVVPPAPTAHAAASPVNSSTPVKEPPSRKVARIQTLTGGNAPWALFVVGVISGLAMMLILLKHAAGMRHLLRNSERFVLHHPMLDTVLISLVVLGSFLSQTTGFIR